jgi:hypothetical protein
MKRQRGGAGLDSAASTSPASVLCVHSAPSSTRKVQLTPENVFEQFLAPMTVPHFLAKVYRQKCLVVHDGGVERLRDLCEKELCDLDLSELAENTASPKLFCWMKSADASLGSIEG